jgi:hypothetical protein
METTEKLPSSRRGDPKYRASNITQALRELYREVFDEDMPEEEESDPTFKRLAGLPELDKNQVDLGKDGKDKKG